MWLALLLLFLPGLPAAAQALTVNASPNPAVVYQKVTLSIGVPAGKGETVTSNFPHRPPGIHLVSGPYVRPVASGGSGAMRVSYVVEGNEAGRFVIPPIAVSIGDRTRMTLPLVLTFGELHGGTLTVPLRPVWTLPGGQRPFYVGEAIPLSLVLQNEVEPTQIHAVRLASPVPGLSPVSGPEQATKRTAGTTTLYQLAAAHYLLMPERGGAINLPAATVEAGDRSGVSPPQVLQISELPAAISESDAIGSLSFRSWTTQRAVADGEEVSLHLRVEGTGNLPRIVLPAPNVHGLMELGKNETHHIRPSADGYSGFREQVYQYLLQSASTGAGPGAGSITLPAFSWLDPRSGIQSVPARSYTVARSLQRSRPPGSGTAGGKGSPTEAAAHPTAGSLTAPPFHLQSAARIRHSEYHELYTHRRVYLWLLPGPFVFGLFLLLRPRRGSKALFGSLLFLLLLSCQELPPNDLLQQGVQAYESGSYDRASRIFRAEQRSYPRNAALSFDLGLVEYRLGRYGNAIHSLRTAIYYAPLSPAYRSALTWMVEQIGVAEQVPPAYPIHPDLFLIGLIVGINAASILGILVIVRRTGGLAIGLILALVFSIIAAGGLAYTAVKRSAETAVVRSAGTEMTKIPMAVAGKWIELPAGMAVRVLDSVQGYYLVETAYGNRGWVQQKRVLIDGN